MYRSLVLNISLPPPYYRKVCDHKNTDLKCIQRAISLVNRNAVTKRQMKKLKVSATSY